MASQAMAADGLIAIAVEATPTPVETTALKRALGPDYGDVRPLMVGHADLNGDHRPDLLARSDSMGGCGSAGCQTWAVLATPSGHAPTAITLAVAAGKVFVLPAMHNGMHDLRFESGDYVFKWNGKEYS
jgi:hypothetical protein